MRAYTWRQIHAWRLAQHGLFPRLKRAELTAAVTRAGGVQAQVLSAAELAIGARVEGLTQPEARAALWQERALVKTWAMRSTLHLLAADALPLFVAAQRWRDNRNWADYFTYYGVSPAEQDAFLAAVPQVLGAEPLTREQLGAAVADRIGAPHVGELIRSANWGSPLKPSAFRGDLCFGPSQGSQVTFVNPRAWIGDWPAIEPEQAIREIARLYLQAYGPATPDNFARWWWGGGGKTQAKKLFTLLADELEEVEVEGWRAFALRTTLDAMQGATPTHTVQLLPLFDGYTFALGRAGEHILASAHMSRVFRPQGWVSAVVLVNGALHGVWQSTTRGRQTAITAQMFAPPTARVRKGIEAEVERMGAFWQANVALTIETL